MPGGFLRLSSIGSPFRMIDSGYAENDALNNQYLEEGTKNYLRK